MAGSKPVVRRGPCGSSRQMTWEECQQESGGHDALPLDASMLVPAQRDQHRKVTEASQPPLAVLPMHAVPPPHWPHSPSPAHALPHALAIPLSPHTVSVW
ncbi:hypothetical protein PLICRDRAFT_172425 [Plicaturopsis crispa FD-325 SS-3]|nr:hypothetical protein PLICRDRAFT_172425 [Plicaturopsis crispa FD-325 SS-3]